MKLSRDEIYLAIQANQFDLIHRAEKYDRLGRRINRSTKLLLPIERFIRNVYLNQISGCWEWTGARSKNGYGQFKPNNGDRYKTGPHRFVFEYLNGPLPHDKEIDHDPCNNRICCNPDHLKAVDHPTNKARARKDKCRHGHAMTPDNVYTYVTPAGRKQRYCKQCRSRLVNRRLKQRMENEPEYRETRLEYQRNRSKSNQVN